MAPRWLLPTGVAVLALFARLVPVLRGGGLAGLGDYDDGVHYAAAVGLVHGRLPYLDFLFLHPPGIIIALAPFAALGRVLGDPIGFAAARLGWMLMGAGNALLVMGILRRQGRAAALIGGAFYALFLPAVYGEHTTQLEGLATTWMLVALMLLGSAQSHRWVWVPAAGAALGVSSSIKIWGVAVVVIVFGWALATLGWRRATAILAGATAGATVLCLPFFLAAPTTMFRMVVLDQLGRPVVHTPLATRAAQIAGLPGHSHSSIPWLCAVLTAFALVTALAAVTKEARLPVALVAGLTLLLTFTPTWFVHYASLIAGPVAVTMGFGAAQLLARARQLSPRVGVAAIVTLSTLVAGYAVPLYSASFGQAFPGSRLASAVRTTPGCVTTDNPTTVIEMDVLGRNLDRGCPLVVDLGGHSYDTPSLPLSRARNEAWQRYALAYLTSGSAVVLARFSAGQGFSRATAASVKHWRVIRRVGRFRLRSTDPSQLTASCRPTLHARTAPGRC